MTKYKVARSHDVRGISYHRSLKAAKESRNKESAHYHIFSWNAPTKFYEGAWRPAE